MHEIKIPCENIVTLVYSQDSCILLVNYIFSRDTKIQNTNIQNTKHRYIRADADPIRIDTQEPITAKNGGLDIGRKKNEFSPILQQMEKI